MRLKTYGTEYIVYLRRGDDTQTVEIVEATGDKEVTDLLSSTYKGRFSDSTGKAPFVIILVKRVDRVKKTADIICKRRIFNLSPRNARIELENAVRMHDN